MILSDIMDEIAASLTAAGYRSYSWPVPTLTPPAAVVVYPDAIDYDLTYRRGCDEISLPVVVVFGRPTDRSTRDLFSNAVRGDGSIKRMLESSSYTSCDSVRVTRATTDVASFAGVEYLAAMFTVQVIGSGT